MPAGFALILIVLFCRPSFAVDPSRTLTQYVHRIWQSPQGLPDATITSIKQTNDGYLWLGTETGLVRFDGVRFSGLTTTPAPLKGAWIRNLLEDSQRRLWVGTNESGIVAFDKGIATQYLQSEGQSRAAVQCLIADHQENVWACTLNGLARLNQGKVTIYGSADGLPTNNIRAACESTDGNIVAGGDSPMLSTWNGSSFVNRTLRSIPPYGSIRALLCSGGIVWIGTTNGLIRLEGGREHLITVADGLADNWIHCLEEGSDGTLWIGTQNGFSRLHNDKVESYRTEDGLSQSTVYSLFEDREGSLWVGTKHGLNQFLDGRTIPYTVSEGLPTNNTGPVLLDHSGTVWIGTFGSGLSRFDDTHHFSVLTAKQGLAGNDVYALSEDRDGSLWVGTDAGLNRLREGRVDRTYTTAQGLPENRIRFLYQDHAGVLWIGTSTGLAMLVDGKLSQANSDPESSHPLILGGGEDASGHFLVATEAGLESYANHQFHEFAPDKTADKTALREIDAFYTDQEGLVWMGTVGYGLRLLKDGKIFSYFMRDGLSDNEIYGITEDAQGRLWMASSKGIFSVNRSDLKKFAAGEIKKFVSNPYSPLDGLRTIEGKPGVQPAVSRTPDGKLWFSTIRGLLLVDPAKLQRRAPVPPVAIEDVTVNGQNESPEQIEAIPPGRKDLEFHYTALSFFAPTAITFRYILDGFDTTWTDASTRRVAYYTNLPPGDFRFRVRACNSDGICNETGSSVAFRLEHQFYQRTWFIPLCAVLFALATWLIWQWRVRHLRQQFELVLSERGRIARELHDTLIQGFSGVTMGMQAVSTGLPPSEERSRLQELIHDAAHCMKQARQTIAGLRGVPAANSEFRDAIAQMARQITKATTINLDLQLESGPSNLRADVENNLLRIVQEAIVNSTRHSDAQTIEVALRFAADRIYLSVRDDGKGMANSDAEADGSVSVGHYGLTGMKERARQIGANFQLITEPAKGTAIYVAVPAPKSRGGTA